MKQMIKFEVKRVFLCKIYGGIFIGRNCILCSAHF